MADEFTAKFRVDISQLKQGIRDANQSIKLANAEFKAAANGMDDWSKSTTGIQAKLKQLTSVLQAQKTKLANYQSQLDKQENAYQENGKRADQLRAKLKELADNGVASTSDEYRKYQRELQNTEKEQQANEKAIDELNITILNQQGAINKTEKDIRNYNTAMDELEQAQKEAEAAAKKQVTAYDALQNTIDEQESTLQGLKREYANVVLSQGENSSSAKKLAKNIDELSSELADNKKRMADADKAADDLDKSLVDLDDAAGDAGGGFTILKGALANLVADGIRNAIQAMKDFVSETINVGKEFDSSMSQVEAVSGATGKELDALRDKAKEMGSTTKFTASEAADAFNYMAMAGWKTEDMLEGIEGVLSLAAASGSDLATTSDIVTDALTAMGYSAKDAGKLADVMAAASSNANTNVEMMGATFKYAAPIVGALGYNMEDTAVAIGLMANAGIKAEQAGTSLRSILTRLSAPPKECASAMEALGISITNADGTMKPLNEVVGQLRKSFAGLSNEQQTSAAKAIAGQEAMSGLLAIVNAAPSDFDKLTKAVAKSDGAAKKMADTMQNNLSGDMTKLGSKLEGVQIALYEKLEPALRSGVKVLDKFLDAINFVIEHATEFTSVIVAAGTGVGTFLTIINRQAIITAFAKGIEMIKGSFIALNAVMAANPWALVAAGVAALVAGFAIYATKLNAASQATLVNVEDTKQLIDAQKELDETIKSNSKNREQSIKFAGEEAQTAEILSGKLSSLMSVENKSAKEKERIKQIVAQLNALMPELNLKYDQEKDKLNKSTEAIKQQITATKELAKAKAAEAALSEIAADMVKKEQERATLTEQLTTNEKAYLKAKEATANFVSKYGMEEISKNSVLQMQYGQLLEAEGKQKTAYENTKTALDKNTESMKKLNQEYDKTGEYASKMFDQAEIKQKIAELTETCKKAGVEIPDAIKQGMEEGKYVVPETVKEMNKLVKFDEAIKQAGLDGVAIPQSISQNVLNGKTSIEEAIKQINKVVKFNEAVEQAQKDGVAIPANLAEKMLSGEISVKEANKQLNEAIKFNDALTKAQQDGVAVPKDLADKIASGKVSVDSANKILNDCIKFDEAIKKANEKGYNIPSTLADKIQSGKMTVEQANTAMNSWIKFQDALTKAGQDGVEIPAKLKSSILNGKTSVDEAVTQMNNWIKFQGAIEAAGLEGYEIPKELQSSILSGKKLTDEAATQLINSIISGLESGNVEMKGVGKDAADGFAEGLKNTDTTNKNATELVTSAINAAKNAQASHSPSEVWRTQVGLSAGQGFAAGLTDSLPLIQSAVSKLISASFSGSSGLVTNMKTLGTQAGQTFANGIGSATGATTSAGNKLKKALVKATTSTLASVGKKAGQTFASGVSSTKGALSKAGTTLKNALTKAATSTLANVGKKAGQTFASGVSATKSAVSKAGTTLKNAVTKAVKTDISSLGKQAGQGFAKGVQSTASAVKSAASKLKSSLTSGAKGGYSSMYSTGQNAAEGFRKGILSKAQSIANAAASVVKKAIAAAKAAQKSASPSKIWRDEIGAMSGEGYIVGLQEQIRPAMKQASIFVTDAIKAANNAVAKNPINVGDLVNGVVGMKRNLSSMNLGSNNLLSGSGNTNNSNSIVQNFTQNINSPKQPSRIELYRQTRNLLALAKEGGI